MFGSRGERELQKSWDTVQRAKRFYGRQMRDHLTERMQALIRRQEMVFVATADASGNCDCSPRFGAEGFVKILDERKIAYPEFRGNGVFASLGNILENPHVGLVFVDFLDTTVGLHVNGTAQICDENDAPISLDLKAYSHNDGAEFLERWVVIDVDEAYIHCSKHVPRLEKIDKRIRWGTDDPKAKSDHFFIAPDSGSDV